MLSQRSEEEGPGQTSRDQEMERLQEERKMHRMAAAAAAAAAAIRCRTSRCSGAAGRRRDRRQSTLSSSHRLPGSFHLVDKVDSPRNVDPQDDGHYAPQVPIQLAAAAVVVGPCSSLHLSQGAAAADAGRPSLAQIHVLQ